jgi:uncharacterized protein (TIGR02246 family)
LTSRSLDKVVTERTVLETTVRAYAASWAARDREAWLRTFATDATQEDPVGAPVRRGHREIGEFWDREMARYRSIEIVPREIFVIDHEAAMVWTINGVTDEGPVSFDGVDGFRSTVQASSRVSAPSGSAARFATPEVNANE